MRFLIAVLVSVVCISCGKDRSVSSVSPESTDPSGSVVRTYAAKPATPSVTLSDLPDSHGGSEFEFTLTYNTSDHPNKHLVVRNAVSVTNGSCRNAKRGHTTPADRNKV